MSLELLKTGGLPRSAAWPKVRKAYLAKHPKCFVCLGTKEITVHHRLPFHIDPTLELEEKNLITLCEGKSTLNCHLIFGHWGNFAKKYNPHIERDARTWRKRFAGKFKMP